MKLLNFDEATNFQLRSWSENGSEESKKPATINWLQCGLSPEREHQFIMESMGLMDELCNKPA